jgi:hypothetical protein
MVFVLLVSMLIVLLASTAGQRVSVVVFYACMM